MPETLAQPILDTHAQSFRGVAPVPTENVLLEPAPQLEAELSEEVMVPYEARHRSTEHVTLSERWRTSTVRRKIGALAAATTAFLAVGTLIEASPAAADDGGVYTVVGTGNGVYARNSPHENDTERKDGLGAYDGDRIQEICGVTNGDPVGERNNHTWHKVKDLDRPDEGIFWISDHWLNTPNVKNELTPGEADCNDGQQSDAESLQPAETVKPFVEFDRSTARQWARDHAEDVPPSDVDACTYFASKVLEAGGLPQDGTWNMRFHNFKMNGQPRYGTGTAWVGPELALYLNRLPYVDVIPLGHMNAGNNNS